MVNRYHHSFLQLRRERLKGWLHSFFYLLLQENMYLTPNVWPAGVSAGDMVGSGGHHLCLLLEQRGLTAGIASLPVSKSQTLTVQLNEKPMRFHRSSVNTIASSFIFFLIWESPWLTLQLGIKIVSAIVHHFVMTQWMQEAFG